MNDDIFFVSGTSKWAIPSSTSVGWVLVDGAAVRKLLKARGFIGRGEAGGNSDVDVEVLRLQQAQHVAFAGGLAGYRRGIHDLCGLRALVLNERAVIEPRPGRYPTVARILRELVPDDAARAVFKGWLAVGVRSLASGTYIPGQALVLAGPRQCGKSLAIDTIVAPLFGGRVARPLQAWCGATAFNADLAQAEVLVIDDDGLTPSPAARRELGQNLKSNLFSGSVRVHAKGVNAVTARPWWRCVFAVNDEPEHLQVLPQLDDSLMDKITLLSCARVSLPADTGDPAGRAALAAEIHAELPHLLHALLAHEVPVHLRDGRTGVVAYHDPAILRALSGLGDEGRLLDLIDEAFADRWPQPQHLSARAVQERLESYEPTRYRARDLLRYSTTCGSLLGRLAATSDRVELGRLRDGLRLYAIRPPAQVVQVVQNDDFTFNA